MHHLERDPVLERMVLGLVDDSHTAHADDTEDSVIAKTLGMGWRWLASRVRPVDGRLRRLHRGSGRGPHIFDPDQCGEQLPDLISSFGAASGVLSYARPLAAPQCRLERFRQFLDRIASGTAMVHHRNSSIPPGEEERPFGLLQVFR